MAQVQTEREASKIKKVILTRLEELPIDKRMTYGLKGKAIIEVSKNSPMTKEIVKTDNYTDYFELKIKEGSHTPEQIRALGKSL